MERFNGKLRDELLNGKIFDTLWEAKQAEAFRQIVLKPLENLSSNIVIRLLYTEAQTGDQWRSRVPRKRVRILTQDAVVMMGGAIPAS